MAGYIDFSVFFQCTTIKLSTYLPCNEQISNFRNSNKCIDFQENVQTFSIFIEKSTVLYLLQMKLYKVAFVLISTSIALFFMAFKTPPDFKNFYGICWRGSPHDNLLYAKHMKYNYVFYQRGMERDTLSNRLYFYIETPEYYTYNRTFDASKAYNKKQIDFYESRFVLRKTDKPFPLNLATGWFFSPTVFTPILDFQQRTVISATVDSILNMVAQIEKINPRFHFGGFAWDVPQLEGDFWDGASLNRKQIGLEYWNKADVSGTKKVRHNYKTYSEGHLAYYKQLIKQTKQQYPNAHFIIEPYKIYENWVRELKGTKDKNSVSIDLISQEAPGLDFLTDQRIQEANIKREILASTTPNIYTEADNRILAANAAINGCIFGWFGRFGGTGDMPNYKTITEVPDRLKLVRIISQWENINKTPLSERSWDGTTYKSPTAFISPDIIAARQPGTKKLFVVFLNPKARLYLTNEEKIKTAYSTDTFFMEKDQAPNDFLITDEYIKPINEESINKGYIFYLY